MLDGVLRFFWYKEGTVHGIQTSRSTGTDSFFDFNQQLSWAGQVNRHAIPNSGRLDHQSYSRKSHEEKKLMDKKEDTYRIQERRRPTRR
jgi:hypothetical protein